mmetsp:Transcript_17071/g.39401  ORF Transcript_17071/g.39401 Transcript_17071/m.39401 type:complete len:279 (-) Transcript_17071:372-1208(-)
MTCGFSDGRGELGSLAVAAASAFATPDSEEDSANLLSVFCISFSVATALGELAILPSVSSSFCNVVDEFSDEEGGGRGRSANGVASNFLVADPVEDFAAVVPSVGISGVLIRVFGSVNPSPSLSASVSLFPSLVSPFVVSLLIFASGAVIDLSTATAATPNVAMTGDPTFSFFRVPMTTFAALFFVTPVCFFAAGANFAGDKDWGDGGRTAGPVLTVTGFGDEVTTGLIAFPGDLIGDGGGLAAVVDENPLPLPSPNIFSNLSVTGALRTSVVADFAF